LRKNDTSQKAKIQLKLPSTTKTREQTQGDI